MISEHQITSWLPALGFEETKAGYSKRYPKHGCEIQVSLDSKFIAYPAEMVVHDQTTSNFSRAENFVVLECVNRLLEKGYSPQNIELEKSWPLGKKNKGKLDILVRRPSGTDPYLMIECKTYEVEFDAEVDKMLQEKSSGGQLFSYWIQDRNAEYLCLYSSRLTSSDTIEYRNNIIPIDDEIRKASSVATAFELWNKQFLHTGIFEDDVLPYKAAVRPLLRCDLKQLRRKDGNLIYSQVLEILRHNGVSDKGNAFNKIFNLFLCKIVDEDRNDSDELEFQWLEGQDTAETLVGRLNGLFKKGMKQYLNKVVTDYNLTDLNLPEDDEKIARAITELRLYKNPDFAFVEIYNEESFNENAKIVVAMVKLLQGWQIRYTYKQQFLGEFFELLLNTGFKQESGQFFTPIPLVRFIIQSLPMAEMIQEKLAAKETDFLPTVIDFACGSGHFLTESMDIIQDKIEVLDQSMLSPTQQKKLKGYRADQFGWAKDSIFGIEIDYRLAKTSKLASFLYGDGEATVIHGSGIDAFSSDSYLGILKTKPGATENSVFDVLVANPPYAVKNFKSYMKQGSATFSLYDDLTERSDEIEALFVERMCQLVKPDGVAGIVLPRSFLNNGGIYEKARRLLLRHFSIRGIVILGSKAFLSTGINTVILFLKKRNEALGEITAQVLEEVGAEKFVLVDTERNGSDEEKRFLGYEFSLRKGSEGIKVRDEFFLYDDDALDSTDYANSYIYQAMLGQPIPEPSERLAKNIRILELGNVISTADLTAAINVDMYEVHHHDDIPMVPIRDHIREIKSGSRPRGGVSEYVAGVHSLGGEHIDEDTGEITLEKAKFVPFEFYQEMPSGHVNADDILVCKDGAKTGKSAYFSGTNSEELCVNEHVFLIREAQETVSQPFLFYFVFSSFFRNQVKKLAFNKKGQPGLNLSHFGQIVLPLFNKAKQDEIVRRIEADWEATTKRGARLKLVDGIFREAGVYDTN